MLYAYVNEYYIYATCKLRAQSGCISCKLHLHAVANVLKISATNNYTLDHIMYQISHKH